MRLLAGAAATLAVVLAAAGGTNAGAIVKRKPGWPVAGISRIWGIVLHDLDGDGSQELIFTGLKGAAPMGPQMFVLDGKGRHRPGWPQTTGIERMHAPLVGDVDGDGRPEIVASDGLRVTVWDAAGRVKGAKAAPVPGMTAEMHSDGGGALGDLDGDGALELVYGVWGNQVAAVSLTGKPSQLPGFPVTIGGVVGGSPALADLDGDGREEVVIADEREGLYLIDLEEGKAVVSRGRDGSGAPVPFTARSSPSVADLEGEGKLSIVVGSYGGDLLAFDAAGVLRWRYPTGQNVHVSAAFADIDADGRLETAFTSYDRYLRVLTPEGRLHPSWEKANIRTAGTFITAGDIDGDELPEILVGGRESILVLDGAGALKLTLSGAGWPLLGDVDGDGRADLVVVWELEVDCFELSTRSGSFLPWPQNRHDARRSGRFQPAPRAPR